MPSTLDIFVRVLQCSVIPFFLGGEEIENPQFSFCDLGSNRNDGWLFFFKRYENRSTQRKTSLKGQEPTTNPQMMPPRLEARPHWWQVSAPPTAPRLLFTCNQCSKSAVRLQKQLHLKLKGDSIHRLLNCGHSYREILCKVAQPRPSQVSSFRYIWYLVRKKKQQRLSLSPRTSLRASSPGVPWGTARAPWKSLLAHYPRTRPSYLTLK